MKKPIEIDERNFVCEVLHSREPVLVNFWAEWAESSPRLASLMAEVTSEFTGRMKVAVVDAEKNTGLARLCFIETLPTLLYFADGLVRDRIVALENKNAVVSRLENLLIQPWGN